jgi:hypothetical protein
MSTARPERRLAPGAQISSLMRFPLFATVDAVRRFVQFISLEWEGMSCTPSREAIQAKARKS